ncbi:MAG: hypothetical protein QNK37_20185 [Acidobacteriota bacterium]|nr:hypothetical protein [Acidobacteriota bacterium]
MAFPTANGKKKDREPGAASVDPAYRESVARALENAAMAAEAACVEGVKLHRVVTTACAAEIYRCVGLDPQAALGIASEAGPGETTTEDAGPTEEPA